MSEPLEELPGRSSPEPAQVRTLTVIADEGAILAPRPVAPHPAHGRTGTVMIPAVQAAAVAAGGFVAGAAVARLVHRHHRRPAGRRLGRGRRRSAAGEGLQIVASRSLLLDVHLLGIPGTDRPS